MLSTVERLAGSSDRAANLAAEVLRDPHLERWPAVEVDARFALAHALARLPGRTTDAAAALDRARTTAHQTTGVAPSDIAFSEARFWALSGDVERALAQLELAVEAGYSDALLLTDPDLAAVRHDGRFATLAQRMGLRSEGEARNGVGVVERSADPPGAPPAGLRSARAAARGIEPRHGRGALCWLARDGKRSLHGAGVPLVAVIPRRPRPLPLQA
jgi:hypothetical protein